MKKAIFLCSLTMIMAGCAATDGDWPSLRTPEEKQALAQGKPLSTASAAPAAAAPESAASAPVSASVPASSATSAPTPALSALAARLAEERRDFDVSYARWEKQKQAVDTAVAAATGAAPASEAWSKAQLELSRLSQAGAKFDEIRTTTNRVAGDLAVLAVSGMDVSATLGDTGRLIRRVDEALEQHRAAAEAADKRLKK